MKSRLLSVPNHSGIYKVQRWNQEKQVWTEPPRGKRFVADRYDPKMKSKVRRYFLDFASAKAFHSGRVEIQHERPTFKSGMLFKDLQEIWMRDYLPNRRAGYAVKNAKVRASKMLSDPLIAKEVALRQGIVNAPPIKHGHGAEEVVKAYEKRNPPGTPIKVEVPLKKTTDPRVLSGAEFLECQRRAQRRTIAEGVNGPVFNRRRRDED